jgi:cell division septum initiation protein DivIVA
MDELHRKVEELEEELEYWKTEAETLHDKMDDLTKTIEEGAYLEKITQAELVELREKYERSEKAPWLVRWKDERIVIGIDDGERFLPVARAEGPAHVWCGNADLIVAAHDALPHLLDEVDRLRERVAILENELEWAKTDPAKK